MIRLLKTAASSAAILAMAGIVGAVNAGSTFTIVPRVTGTAVLDLELRRMEDFEADVSLRVRTDPRLVPNDRVIELVEAIGMVDGAGMRIVSGYAVDVDNDLVIGWSGGTAEIVKVRKSSEGLEVIGLFKDGAGRIITPPEGSLAAYTIDGERLCFEYAVVEEAIVPPPMSFVLLLDRSGSMSSVMSAVRVAAQRFIDALPSSASCLVGAFDSGWSFREEEGFGLNQCEARHFPMNGLRANGSTELYPALNTVYDWLHQPVRADHQKAVIILTDGGVTPSGIAIADVLAEKGDALTFVYFLGGSEARFLQGIADSFLSHQGDLESQLARYFEVVSTAYRKQSVLRLKSCGAVNGQAHGHP